MWVREEEPGLVFDIFRFFSALCWWRMPRTDLSWKDEAWGNMKLSRFCTQSVTNRTLETFLSLALPMRPFRLHPIPSNADGSWWHPHHIWKLLTLVPEIYPTSSMISECHWMKPVLTLITQTLGSWHILRVWGQWDIPPCGRNEIQTKQHLSEKTSHSFPLIQDMANLPFVPWHLTETWLLLKTAEWDGAADRKTGIFEEETISCGIISTKLNHIICNYVAWQYLECTMLVS